MNPAVHLSEPRVIHADGRCFLSVAWDQADVLREALRRGGCPTTLCLNPETREARLELWPGVDPESALAVLEMRRTGRKQVTSSAVTPDRPRDAAPAPMADLICI
jgi:hypothetical protein